MAFDIVNLLVRILTISFLVNLYFSTKWLRLPTASPIFTRKPPPQVHVDGGSTLKLCCEADGHVVWSRSGTALTTLPYFQQDGCLTISSVDRGSTGKYTGRATNQFGISEATFEVILRGDVSLSRCFAFVFKLAIISGWQNICS